MPPARPNRVRTQALLRAGAVTVAVAALALLLPAEAISQDRTIAVSGTATEEVPNDAASVGLSVSRERRTRQAALRATAVGLRRVIAAVQAVPGVGPGAITTGNISVREISRHEHQLFRASEGISVALGQPDKAGELISAAVAAGATGTRGPNFYPSDPDTAYRNTLLRAFDLAYQKAAALATRAGAVLGPAITIEETSAVTPPVPAAAAPRARGGGPTPPTKPGGSTVTATVRVVFALQ
jgi:uncharacterized protein YggE